MTFAQRKQILDGDLEFVASECAMNLIRGRAGEDILFWHLFGCFPEDGSKAELPMRQEFELGDWQMVVTLELLNETVSDDARQDCP